MGKTPLPDTTRYTPRERELAGALYASGEQQGEETGKPEEALCANKDRIGSGMAKPEESVYTNRGGRVRGTQEAKEASPPCGDRMQQQGELRSKTARGWVSAYNLRSSRGHGEVAQDTGSWTSPTGEKDSNGT
ncbi:hypothetical protein Y1Q_0003040 [Alligator mississippiensis]|uniref:Uncharacterized protein n=1 Tax=Alligator mississippiensis TaxID=8496 RepID=A0A151MDA6_ALLMI|nr:hypothetical protein Y1Q_0003040 [Alligator mississippiensis]